MGVPGFFGWLVQHCKTALVSARRADTPQTRDEQREAGDDTALSRTQMDCLYLDMNGIIHPCCHPDSDAPNSEEEMLARVCLKVDEIMDLVRPTTLLFLAIDGTAPRAKMNQQRTRRFRGAQVRDMERKIIGQLKDDWTEAKIPPPADEHLEPWDSNVITPGTPFMDRVAQALQHYIALRVSSDPKWANLAVIFSGSNEPGEGEHKIIQYIKRQRMQPGYDPNLKHCIVGEDADLIMLAMSIHTPHMYILRTARPPRGRDRNKPYCKFNYLVISVVMGYFEKVFQPVLEDQNIPEGGRQVPRMLDDLTLVFCLVGNDFLPNIPGMKIQHNAIGVSLLAYLDCFSEFKGGYLTDNGSVDFANLGILLEKLKRNFRTVSDRDSMMMVQESMQSKPPEQPPSLAECLSLGAAQRTSVFLQQAKYHLDMQIDRDISEAKGGDLVKIGTGGWDLRYYKLNFATELARIAERHGRDEPSDADVEELKRSVAYEYLRGLSWVVAYYFQECPSWDWYFPYHYAPVLPTVNVGDILEVINSGKALYEPSNPYTPFEQLTAVLPQETAVRVLPKPFHKYVESKSSVLHQYYPANFVVDLRQCPPPWHCTVILPFIDDKIFLPILKKVQAKLESEADKARNARAAPVLYVGKKHPLYEQLNAYAHASTGAKKAAATSAVSMSEDVQIGAELLPPANAWDKKAVVHDGTRLETPFTTPHWVETFPTVEKSAAVRCHVAWPPLNNRSFVLEGTEVPNHASRLKPGGSCRKPSHSFQTKATRQGLPLVLQPGPRLDRLQGYWAQEVMPCWNFVNFGSCRYGDRCHYSHESKVVDKARVGTAPPPDTNDPSAAGAWAAEASKQTPAAAPMEVDAPAAKASPMEVDTAPKVSKKEAKAQKKAAKKRSAADVKAEDAAMSYDYTKVYVTTGANVKRDDVAAYIKARTGVDAQQVKWKMPGGKNEGVMVVRFGANDDGLKVFTAVNGAVLPGAGSLPLSLELAPQKSEAAAAAAVTPAVAAAEESVGEPSSKRRRVVAKKLPKKTKVHVAAATGETKAERKLRALKAQKKLQKLAEKKKKQRK